VSDDGLIVTGYVYSNLGQSQPYRWTQAGGMQVITTLADGTDSFGWTISGDGLTVAGSYINHGLMNRIAYRWTQSPGMVALEYPYPPGGSSQCNGLSTDGSVIVGYKDFFPGTNGTFAFRWTSAGGTQNLGTLPGDVGSYAAAVSEDGSVVVGYSSASSGAVHSFRWTPAQGMQDLGTVAGRPASTAYAISSDGSFIAGTTGPSFPLSIPGAVAYLWSTPAGMRGLGMPAGATYSRAYGVSSVGPVVVGFAANAQGDRAMLWNAGLGPVYLDQYLSSLGVSLTGWTLTNAHAITPDGRTIVGWGVHNGHTEGWIATIPPPCGSADFNADGDAGTDADIEAFFACLAGDCCPTCGSPDFNGDGQARTDADIEAFFRVLGGGSC
jgi:probable HAF family extracellular repeat protein